MPRTKNVLDDEDILVRVNAKSREAIGWYDSKLSRERERVLQYYNGTLPKRQSIGSASFVSTDVYDSVEMLKAQLLEVFGAGDDIAQFDPDQDMDLDACLAASAYARNIIFQQNPGFTIFNHVMHDGLTARIGVAKVWWEEKYDYEEEDFHDLPLEQVHALAAQDEIDDMEATLDEKSGLFSGHLIRKVDRCQVRIINVPPEEFLIEPRAVDFAHRPYCAHRTLKTKPELKSMGFDPKQVDSLHYDDNKGLDLSPEVLARNAPVETFQALDNPIQKEMEKVMLYESYAEMVIDKAKGARLYKFFHADNVLFEYEEVDRVPFQVYVPLPIPHLFYGNSFAARVIPTQNARTVLIRAVLDHASMTINPRWQVVNGGLLNPREMLDNRMGGLVNVRRPDTVSALATPNLNPFVFEVLQDLEQLNEKSTGVSSLSQGLNKDALSKQNSRGLVGDMVNLSTQRQKIAARNFAYNFFAPLMMEVIRLAIMNEKQQKIVEVAGKPIQVNPQSWTERRVCTVSMHLGYGEKDAMVEKMSTAYEKMAEDPMLQNVFGLQQRYNMVIDTLKLAGINKAPYYLAQPNTVPPVQPDPLKTQELKIKGQMAQAALTTAQGKVANDQRLSQADAIKAAVDQLRVHLEALTQDREQNRKDLEVAARVQTANREMNLEERMRPQELNASMSPNP